MLESASRLVKAGGRLVYATCSVLKEENQAVVEAFLAAHPEFHLLNASEVLEGQGVKVPAEVKDRFGPWFVMLPQVTGTDGFFGAVLERDPDAPRRRKPAPEAEAPSEETESVKAEVTETAAPVSEEQKAE